MHRTFNRLVIKLFLSSHYYFFQVTAIWIKHMMNPHRIYVSILHFYWNKVHKISMKMTTDS